ncbi:Predicted amidohydrolase [Alteribacillus persepolensis]|uniref:Predicted amidohydrolase n=1 Tax=Alteribacillus persepolensis TaxID=568899 RepID=A0A1G8AUM1_9BACI|nr:carbon-nitrogen family hydrolase [Alteribacillus persepolensis]SDH24564.1 Predicted amidohydrolase [Alteribacillus persepolensis]
MIISSIQMDIVPGDPKQNRQNVETLVSKEVKQNQPDIIVLPEMWTTAYTLPQLTDIADHETSNTIPFLQQLASTHNVHLAAGSIAYQQGDDMFNRALIINRNGELVYHYDKLHLVPMLNEPDYLTGGKHKAQVFELGGIKMGVIICYDLRFPELVRALALEGAQVIFLPAEWPDARRDHWRYLQLARAIENQVYMISCNRIGTYNNTTFAGHSMIIDPWGSILAEGSTDQAEVIRASLSPEKVTEVRQQVPVFSSRVPHYYA